MLMAEAAIEGDVFTHLPTGVNKHAILVLSILEGDENGVLSVT